MLIVVASAIGRHIIAPIIVGGIMIVVDRLINDKMNAIEEKNIVETEESETQDEVS